MGNPFEGLFDSGDVLERVGIDITAQARRGGLEPVRCRDAEIARVVDILLRQGKNNAALVGKAGVGKTAARPSGASTRTGSVGSSRRCRPTAISFSSSTSYTTSSARARRWGPRWTRGTC